MKKKMICLTFIFVFSVVSANEMTVHYRKPYSEKDLRSTYYLTILDKSLEATEDKYGKYNLVPTLRFNIKRATRLEYIKTIENFIFENSANERDERNLYSIKIPIYKGIFGYRLFLIHKQNQDLFSKVNNINDLRKLKFGQGFGWLDVDILRDSEFEVVTNVDYTSSFRMLMAKRFEGFPRGIHEAFLEYDSKKDEFPDLAVEKTLCLYYPLPRFFYTAKENTLLIKRVEEGLDIIIKNGIFDKIWHEYFDIFLERAKFSNRKIIKIDNAFIPDFVNLLDSKYWFKL